MEFKTDCGGFETSLSACFQTDTNVFNFGCKRQDFAGVICDHQICKKKINLVITMTICI